MATFNMLPLEIMLEILSRLPIKSSLECKLVSKPWRNLVRHPCFSRLHLNHLNDLDSAHDSSKSSFIFYKPKLYTKRQYDLQYSYTEYEYDENFNRFRSTTRMDLSSACKDYLLIGSCNGLIYFYAWFYNNYRPFYVCNPVTREYITLPKVEGTCLFTGFGYSPSTNEYKIVTICNSKTDSNFGIVQVYTLGSGLGWRKVRKMDYDVTSRSIQGVFFNGAVYWVSKKGTIFAFNLADEEIRIIFSPPCLPRTGKKTWYFELHALGDFLCAYHKHSKYSDIWVFQKNGNDQDAIWSKEFSHLSVKPITFTKSGGLLCYDYREKNVYHYAPNSSSSRMLVNFGEKLKARVPHKNTLVSLRALGEEDVKLMDPGERASSWGETKAVSISQQKRRKKEVFREVQTDC